MRRRLLGVALVALLAAAAPAAAAVGLRWSPLAAGTTIPSGSQTATGYVAVTRTQEARFAQRLDASSRAALARVNLQRTGVVAVFLDGAPCSSKLTVKRVTRTATTLTVSLVFTPPPVGMATCVRTSTAYLLLGVARSSLGTPAPRRVIVAATPRT